MKTFNHGKRIFQYDQISVKQLQVLLQGMHLYKNNTHITSVNELINCDAPNSPSTIK